MVSGDETLASDNKHPCVGAIRGNRLSITEHMMRHDRLAAESHEGRRVHGSCCDGRKKKERKGDNNR